LGPTEYAFTWGRRQNPVFETLFLNKNWTMDNVQKTNNGISAVLYMDVSEWVSEWVNGWKREWVSEWIFYMEVHEHNIIHSYSYLEIQVFLQWELDIYGHSIVHCIQNFILHKCYWYSVLYTVKPVTLATTSSQPPAIIGRTFTELAKSY
jgi:hypothetical protein